MSGQPAYKVFLKYIVFFVHHAYLQNAEYEIRIFLWLYDWSLWQEQIDFLWQIYKIISYIFILQVYYDKINLQHAWPTKLKHILSTILQGLLFFQ